jgi:hypothetical protein
MNPNSQYEFDFLNKAHVLESSVKSKPSHVIVIYGNFWVTKPGFYKYSISDGIENVIFDVHGNGFSISSDGWMTVSNTAKGQFVIFVENEISKGAFFGRVVN